MFIVVGPSTQGTSVVPARKIIMVPDGPEQRHNREVEKLAKYVKTVACAQFVLTAVAQVFIGFGAVAAAPHLPADYSDFVRTCDEPQSALKAICDAWKQNCEKKQLGLRHCNDDGDYSKFRQIVSSAFLGGALMSTVVAICCDACVPACGFIGARDRNTCLLLACIVFNVLTLTFSTWQMISAMNLVGFLALVMPGISSYFACKLRHKISNPTVQQGLLPHAYTQTTTAQPPSTNPSVGLPVLAQATVVNPMANRQQQPPNAQHQAFMGAT